MENRQNKPPEGGAASGHGGQKFHTDSEQAKLHKSKLRMESREERLNKARERLAKQKPPKKPGPIKRIARIAGHETHAFLHGKVYQEERDNVGVEGGHFVSVPARLRCTMGGTRYAGPSGSTRPRPPPVRSPGTSRPRRTIIPASSRRSSRRRRAPPPGYGTATS